MIGRTLKFTIVASMALINYAWTTACPTCIGRIMLGVKKPFFKEYQPKPINKRRKKNKKKYELSYKKTETLKEKSLATNNEIGHKSPNAKE